MYPAVVLMYFNSAAVILLASLALTVQVCLKKICPASFRETCQWLEFPPEWVTGTQQVKSSDRIATFILWTGVLRDGISSIPGETVKPL